MKKIETFFYYVQGNLIKNEQYIKSFRSSINTQNGCIDVSFLLYLPCWSNSCRISLSSREPLTSVHFLYPFLRKWTFSTQSSFICPQHGIELNYGRLIGSTLNPIKKRAKVLFKAILWNHLPTSLLSSNCSSPLFNFPNYIEVKS